jgi:1-acyl-sn-glycerol-3-phosphate acyltransferase
MTSQPGTDEIPGAPQTPVPHSSQPRRDEWDPKPSRTQPALRWLTYLLLLPLITVATAFYGVISFLCALWDRSGYQQHVIASIWARTLLLLSLSPAEVIGLERLNPTQPAVYASNHLSYYDTPLVFAKLPFQFRIFAKQSLWKTPFIGWYLHRSGQVPIDISTGRSAVTSLRRGVDTLEAGMSLFLFPEGGRAAHGQMTPFQSGAAWMAIKAMFMVFPLVLFGF